MAVREKKPKAPTAQRTASITVEAGDAERIALDALQAAYAAACNMLVSIVVETRCWNRYNLHRLAYRRRRAAMPLGSQMCCNVLRTVTGACRSVHSNGGIPKHEPVPEINFRRACVHFDARTFAMRGDQLSLYTLTGRVTVTLRPREHQKRLLAWGGPKEAELIARKGKWFFNLVREKEIEFKAFGPVLGLDVGQNNLAATNTGKIWGGGKLRHERDCCLALPRCLQSNGSRSTKQLLRKVSGKERRHMRHVNHATRRQAIAEAERFGGRAIAMEDLTHIRKRIKAGLRVSSRLHRWALRQLQDFVAHKVADDDIATLFTVPAYTSKVCSECGQIGSRVKHCLTCNCGRAQRHQCRVEPCPAWRDSPFAKGRCKPALW
jgi:putative transposase